MKDKVGYDGVWRTIRGRRVFIRNGEDLSSAMKRSGKFDNLKREDVVKAKREVKSQEINDEYNAIRNEENKISDKRTRYGKYKQSVLSAHRMQLNEEEDKFLKDTDIYINYDNPKKYKGDISNLKGKHIAGRETRAREIDKINKDKTLMKTQGLAYEDYKRAKLGLRNYDEDKINSEEDYIKVKRYPDDPSNKEYTYVKRNLEEDSSPMSEWSDTTGTGLSDKQSTALNKMSITELRNMANEYNVDTKGKSKKQLLSALISMFNK